MVLKDFISDERLDIYEKHLKVEPHQVKKRALRRS